MASITVYIELALLLGTYLNVVECKVWSFAFAPDYFADSHKFNPSTRLEGQGIDMVKKICKLAGKNCKIVTEQRVECWSDDTRTSKILNKKKHDVCANLIETRDRNIDYRFAGQNMFRIPNPALIRKPGSTVTVDDLKQCNGHTLAFPSMTGLNVDCLSSQGMYININNTKQINVTTTFLSAMIEIEDTVVSGKADVGIVAPRQLFRNKSEIFGESPCFSSKIGLNIMVNQDDEEADEFLSWWEPTLKGFICTEDKSYKRFCKKLRKKYGVDPLCYTAGVDIDCPGRPIVTTSITNPCSVQPPVTVDM